MKIAESDRGYLEFDGNELSIVSTIEDPPAVRLAAAGGGSLGKISFNRLRAGGSQAEKVLVQGKGEGSGEAGVFRVDLQRPNTEDDANMVRMFEASNEVAQFNTPRILDMHGNPLGSVGAAPPKDVLRSANGRFSLNMQNDGNLVIYDTVAGTVLWATMTVVA